MHIQSSFEVAAPPDRVYAFLLDVNRVVGCMPGAELTEVVDPDTFQGKVRIKVGPITVAYNGTARITQRDLETRTARLEASGRETTGPGGAEASAVMTVTGADGGSAVRIDTEYVVRGRVANFGRGVMEDVSRRLVGQMADCIKSSLEAATAEAAASGSSQAAAAHSPEDAAASPPGAGSQAPAGAAAPLPTPARPVNALGLFFSVLWDRIRRLFRRRQPLS